MNEKKNGRLLLFINMILFVFLWKEKKKKMAQHWKSNHELQCLSIIEKEPLFREREREKYIYSKIVAILFKTTRKKRKKSVVVVRLISQFSIHPSIHPSLINIKLLIIISSIPLILICIYFFVVFAFLLRSVQQ